MYNFKSNIAHLNYNTDITVIRIDERLTVKTSIIIFHSHSLTKSDNTYSPTYLSSTFYHKSETCEYNIIAPSLTEQIAYYTLPHIMQTQTAIQFPLRQLRQGNGFRCFCNKLLR